MACKFTVGPVSFVAFTIVIFHLTKAVFFRVNELALIKVSVLVLLLALAFLFTFDPVAFVVITIVILHLTETVSSRLAEFAFVKVSVLVLVLALAFLFTFEPVAFVASTIEILHLTKAVSSRLAEFAFVEVSVVVLIFTLALLHVFIPVPIIVYLIYSAWRFGISKFSFSVSITIFVVSLVRDATRLLVLSIASNHVSFKLALVHILILVGKFTTTMTLIFQPITIVAVSILVVTHSLARPFVLIKVTFV